MHIKCIVIDDEQLSRKLLEEYISKVPEIELVAEFKDPIEALTILNEQAIDLIFLDIQMPNLTGMEFLGSIKPEADVVITTAYTEYAVEGYSLDVKDYLLKPYTFDRFALSVNKVTKSILLKQNTRANQIKVEYITVNSGHKIFKILLDDIDYIEGLKEYVSIYVKGRRIITLQSLKHLEDTLFRNKFLRVHRSYIVPIDKVDVLERNQLRIKDKLIPIGRSYKEIVLSIIFTDSQINENNLPRK